MTQKQRQRRRRDYEDPDGQPEEYPPKPSARKRRKLGGYDIESEFNLDDSTPPALFRGDPAAVIPKDTRLVVQGKKYFKLAPHQRTIEAHFLGRFGAGMEGEYGFKVLRDPRTGYPVVRDHGDLKPGEVSLVLE